MDIFSIHVFMYFNQKTLFIFFKQDWCENFCQEEELFLPSNFQIIQDDGEIFLRVVFIILIALKINTKYESNRTSSVY